MSKKEKVTLEEKLIKDGWFENEKEIQAWLMSRLILVDNEVMTSGKIKILADSEIRVKEYYKKRFVNKGGLKLEKAIQEFNINIQNKVALDCGASTGGFTDCLLYYGAKKVYAVDVGFGQLAGKLLQDNRVVNLERTNLSDTILLNLEEKPEIISLDLSYLSLKKAVPICRNIISDDRGILICLVKPLYEVESAEIKRTGNINDENILETVLVDLYEYFKAMGYYIKGITNSPITGNKGTVEFLFCLDFSMPCINENDDMMRQQIKAAVQNGIKLQKFDKKYINI